MVTGHVRWYGTVLAAHSNVARVTGRTPEQITVSEAATFDALITAEEFPALRQAIDAGVFLSEGDPFMFAFERILDGIAAYLDALAAGGKRAGMAPWAELDDADIIGDKRSGKPARLCAMRRRNCATRSSSSAWPRATPATVWRVIRPDEQPGSHEPHRFTRVAPTP